MDGAVAAQFLETYRGRDKIYRLISYLSQLVAGSLEKLGHVKSAERLEALGGALSACRVVLRLGDDLAMWQVTKSFGLGSQERNPLLRILGVVQNVFDQLYYPLEHLAWACDVGVVKRPSALYWVASVAAWGMSLVTSIFTSLVKLHKLNLDIAARRRSMLSVGEPSSLASVRGGGDEDGDSDDEEDDDEDEGEEGDEVVADASHAAPSAASAAAGNSALYQSKHRDYTLHHSPDRRQQQQRHHQQRRQPPQRQLSAGTRLSPQRDTVPLETQRFELLLELMQYVADLANAIHWMPPGFLWGGRLPSIAVGLNGTVSSLLGLYRMMAALQRQRQRQQPGHEHTDS